MTALKSTGSCILNIILDNCRYLKGEYVMVISTFFGENWVEILTECAQSLLSGLEL